MRPDPLQVLLDANRVVPVTVDGGFARRDSVSGEPLFATVHRPHGAIKGGSARHRKGVRAIAR